MATRSEVRSRDRAVAYQTRREVPAAVGLLMVALLEFAVVGILGNTFPEAGWGGAFAGFVGLAIGTYTYSMANNRGNYGVAAGVGLLMSLGFILLQIVIPFGSAIVGLWFAGTFVGEVAFLIVMVSSVILLLEGVIVTKRNDLV